MKMREQKALAIARPGAVWHFATSPTHPSSLNVPQAWPECSSRWCPQPHRGRGLSMTRMDITCVGHTCPGREWTWSPRPRGKCCFIGPANSFRSHMRVSLRRMPQPQRKIACKHKHSLLYLNYYWTWHRPLPRPEHQCKLPDEKQAINNGQ